jgi:ribosomal-protein-serine acetyltransferase
MQKRLSARPSGALEGVGPGGGFDSGLKPVTPEIKTNIPSLKLRLLREEDAEELFLRNDQNREHLRQWMPWLDETKSPSDTLNFIRRSLAGIIAGTQYSYAILLVDELVGVVALNNIDKLNRCATMGYWLAKSKMGKGYMTAAVKALIDEGFQHLELNRIQARVATANYPSQAVCDRLGLKKEGVLRQAEWLYDHYVDLTINSVLRSEWKAQPNRKKSYVRTMTDERLQQKSLHADTTFRYRRNGICRSVGISLRLRTCLRSDATLLGQRSKNRVQDHQRAG